MNDFSKIGLEIAVVVLALGILLGGLWTPPERKRMLGYIAALGVGLILTFSVLQFGERHFITQHGGMATAQTLFGGMVAPDSLTFFFQAFFLLAGLLVLLMSVEFADRLASGIAEFFVLLLLALTGMLFAASANDLVMVFVSLELITISFYVLVSFQKTRLILLEAGLKYLILGALSTAFLVFGIAFIFGTAGTTSFAGIAGFLRETPDAVKNPVFLLGVLMVLSALGFKIAAVPFQMWAPDVYQGAPTPATAFLAVGSKAAGIVLLMRFLFGISPDLAVAWHKPLMVIAGLTILYGNLCAIPQRNLKRLLGYSSIANAGYLLMGFATCSVSGLAAMGYYLCGYLFTLMAAFAVLCIVTRGLDSEDVSAVAGLHRRSPFLAAVLTLAMVSLAGVPPTAGFFGKFLLLKSVLEQGAADGGFYWLLGAAVFGILISFYYYFGVVRAIYWGKESDEVPAIQMRPLTRLALWICAVGILWLGTVPSAPLNFIRTTAAAFGGLP